MKLKFFITLLLTTFIGSAVSHAQISANRMIWVEPVDSGISVRYNTGTYWSEVMRITTSANIMSSCSKKYTTVSYDMQVGKKKLCSNMYARAEYTDSSKNEKMLVRVYNDGVAFKAVKPNAVNVRFGCDARTWLQRWSEPYEEFFPQNRETKAGDRIAYPALFECNQGLYALLSESDITAQNAATSMYCTEDRNVFELRPDGNEEGGWQTLILGSLSDVVESTLITDNSAENKIGKKDWVKPGVASWVYWAYNHGSNDYEIIKKYVDMAKELHLPYVLIDAEWDEMKDGKTVEDAVNYAKKNGIRPMIWYNSSVGWINGAPGPKFKLNDPDKREAEFAWCEKIGVKGVKIDFFSGDNNMNMKYMIDLLESAARHHLLVNFHGATLPRGWQRTYPNLISTEAVYGAEWYNNVPTFTKKAAAHNATLPFTRNVVGSMDYTPCAFTDSQHPHITTHAHELALTALFESGIQHLADRPESFLAQPKEVKAYLSKLPTVWDETKLIGGYPGEYAVMARRSGKVWYIAGINGSDHERVIQMNYNRLEHTGKKITLFADSRNDSSPWEISTLKELPAAVTCKPRGGFVIVVK